MLCGDVEGLENVPVRVHGSVLDERSVGIVKVDCKQQLDLALNAAITS